MDYKDHHAGLDTEAGFVQVMNPEAAEAFGKAMRKAREDAGITLERAAILTRISPAFIQALESGEFKKLPGVVFARGFVRNLCKPYRKSSSDMLELFDLAVRHPGEAAASSSQVDREEEVVTSEARARTPFNASRAFALWTGLSTRLQAVKPMLAARKRTLAVGGGSVAALLLVGLVTSRLPERKADEAVTAEAPAPVATADVNETSEVAVADIAPAETPAEVPAAQLPDAAKAAIAEAMVKNQEASRGAVALKAPEKPVAQPPVTEEKASSPAAAPQTAPLAVGFKSDAGNNRQVVEIHAKSQVVVRFSKDGGAFETRTLEPRAHSFDFRDEAQLLVFDAGAVDVKFNGRALGPLGNKGRVRRISFRKDDLSDDKNF